MITQRHPTGQWHQKSDAKASDHTTNAWRQSSHDRELESIKTVQAMKTSIIIPCYNEKNAIRETIEGIGSVIQEAKLNDVEIIAVNDGSTDGSEHVLNALAAESLSGNLLVVHHKRNQGYGAALKTGIRRSQSDYICITDADGTYPNERIPELIEQITSKDLDMVVGARICLLYTSPSPRDCQ